MSTARAADSSPLKQSRRERLPEEGGELCARLEEAGQLLADADLQIAATAIYHDLELVTGNLRHFRRVEQLRIVDVLYQTRQSS